MYNILFFMVFRAGAARCFALPVQFNASSLDVPGK